MADITVKVITPATSISFVTLDEVKTFLGLTTTSTPAEDAQLSLMMDIASATIMRVCNRYFAREEVQESWRDVYNGRLFLTHWPVAEADIQSVSIGDGPTVLDSTAYQLEERSGKLSTYGTSNWQQEPAVVHYTGGYDLPDDAPLPLKQAAFILIREQKLQAARLSITGIRSLMHKSARVQFFDYTKPITYPAGHIMLGTGDPVVDSLLSHYIRLEV